jgi:hypothetical protein
MLRLESVVSTHKEKRMISRVSGMQGTRVTYNQPTFKSKNPADSFDKWKVSKSLGDIHADLVYNKVFDLKNAVKVVDSATGETSYTISSFDKQKQLQISVPPEISTKPKKITYSDGKTSPLTLEATYNADGKSVLIGTIVSFVKKNVTGKED